MQEKIKPIDLKKQYFLERKATLKAEYLELKKDKLIKQQQRFDLIALKYGLSAVTVRQIIFNSNYPQKKTT